MVFQEPRLIPWQRVLPNVALGLRPGAGGRGRPAAAEPRGAGRGRAGRPCHAWPVTLSGGEAQRVALARALVREPQLMLLDEPFGALDALTRTRMHVLLQDLCARHRPAVLLVTHDVDEAILLADRALVLVDGQITLDAPVGLGPAQGPGRPRLHRAAVPAAARARGAGAPMPAPTMDRGGLNFRRDVEVDCGRSGSRIRQPQSNHRANRAWSASRTETAENENAIQALMTATADIEQQRRSRCGRWPGTSARTSPGSTSPSR